MVMARDANASKVLGRRAHVALMHVMHGKGRICVDVHWRTKQRGGVGT